MKTQWHYLHTDHLGTPYMATNRQGEKTWRAYANAFGEAIIDKKSTTTINLRFPEQYYDEETGTHYNFQRDYTPYTGRYLQADPIGIKGSVNVYGYSINPLAKFDPMGLRAVGRWIEKPSCDLWSLVKGINYRKTVSSAHDFRVLPLSAWDMNRFLFIHILSIKVTAYGRISFEVECEKECRRWNVSVNKEIPAPEKEFTFGPNALAVAAGLYVRSLKVYSQINAALILGKLGWSIYKYYGGYAYAACQTILGHGPDAICNNELPETF